MVNGINEAMLAMLLIAEAGEIGKMSAGNSEYLQSQVNVKIFCHVAIKTTLAYAKKLDSPRQNRDRCMTYIGRR